MTFDDVTAEGIEIDNHPFSQVFIGSSTQENEVTMDYLLSNLSTNKLSRKFYHNLQLVFQIDSISSTNQIPKTRDDLIKTKEPYRRDIRSVLKSASKLIDKLIGEEDIFQRINRDKFSESLFRIMKKIPSEQLLVSEDELAKRIKKIMFLEVMSGILDELTPKQRDDFETETKRRPFFK